MDWFSALCIVALMAAFSIAVGLIRRGRHALGLLLAAAGTAAAVFLAVSGLWGPVLYLLAALSLFAGLEIDQPGRPVRRALGLLGIAAWLVALVIAGLYT